MVEQLSLPGSGMNRGGSQWLDLDGASGTFVAYEDHTSIGSPNSSSPAISAKGFSGNLIIANSNVGANVDLSASTLSNVLLLGDIFASPVTHPVIEGVTPNSSVQTATINPIWVDGGVAYPDLDEMSPGTSRTDLLQKSLAQLASYKDPAVEDLPNANENVRIIDVVVNDGLNAFDFESSSLGLSPTPAARRSTPGGAFHSSQLSSLWCGRKPAREAEPSSTQRRPEANVMTSKLRVQSLAIGYDRCSVNR